jgi:hypothetical protein
MNLPISVFEIMAEIAKENRIRSIKWARASGVSPSRISDIKRLRKRLKAGAADPAQERDVMKDGFSLNNFFSLWDGLKTLVGGKGLQAGLIKQLEIRKPRPSTKVRLYMRLMALNDSQLRLVDILADAILHRVNTISSQNEH